MSRRMRQRVADERGAVLVAGLLLSLALLIVIGAAVDIGRAFIGAANSSRSPTKPHFRAAKLSTSRPSMRASSSSIRARRRLLRSQCSQANPNCGSSKCEPRIGERRGGPRDATTVLLRLVGLPTLTVKARATAEPRAP